MSNWDIIYYEYMFVLIAYVIFVIYSNYKIFKSKTVNGKFLFLKLKFLKKTLKQNSFRKKSIFCRKIIRWLHLVI